jgi:hypothetical protein
MDPAMCGSLGGFVLLMARITLFGLGLLGVVFIALWVFRRFGW